MTKALIFLFASFALAFICGPVLIPLLRRLKAGQTVRDNGPQTHLVKNGTPTIGGLIFLLPMTVLSVAAYFTGNCENILPLIITTVLYGAVGFADDFLKVVKKNKDGLLWYQKLAALIVVSVLFAVYMKVKGITSSVVDFPLFGLDLKFNMGFMYIPFCVFIMVAESNAVNITDGLDGLCAGSMIIVMTFFAVVSAMRGNMSACIFSAITTGSLLGFLFFNLHPAKVFMGDTGSLALGAAFGVVGIYLKIPFILVLCGLLFVIEALSVLLQVSYYKISHGKRIFKMAPIHHHFELSGWKETVVVYVFWGFTLVCCIAAYFCVMV